MYVFNVNHKSVPIYHNESTNSNITCTHVDMYTEYMCRHDDSAIISGGVPEEVGHRF